MNLPTFLAIANLCFMSANVLHRRGQSGEPFFHPPVSLGQRVVAHLLLASMVVSALLLLAEQTDHTPLLVCATLQNLALNSHAIAQRRNARKRGQIPSLSSVHENQA